MANQSFWLADIGDHSIVVSYINVDTGTSQISSIGPACPWDESNPQSFTTAVDQSLSEAATAANLAEDLEPNSIALIVPPFWIGSDGRITSDKRKLLETMSKDLKLKPMGFIGNDEAIVEVANISDGFPASFVLVNISPAEIVVSLTYLGHVTERIVKNIPGSFDPELLESAILEFKSESALPPQIILFGQIDDSIVESVKNYPWIGKKNIETFLHFPEVKVYNSQEIVPIYSRAITSQFSSPPVMAVVPEVEPESDSDADSETKPKIKSELTEVSPEELGFSNDEDQNLIIPETVPEIVPELIETKIEPKTTPSKFTLPKFSLPRIKLPAVNILLLPLGLFPLLILIPFFFSTGHFTFYLTPYTFNKTVSATFDPQAQTADLSKKIIPINRQNISINTSVSLATTGQKTVGDKAKGEITIFNKQDKPQSLSAGAILIDSQGNRFSLDNNTQIPASSSNLDLGVITLGQVKVTASSVDIGPEYNLAKDTSLHFKDFAESLIIAKVSVPFSGGSKRQIGAVAPADKIQLESKLTAEINSAVKSRLDQEISQNPNIIRDATQIQKGRIDYNREVSEEADQLTGTAVSNIYIYYLDPQKKLDLINSVLASESNFSAAVIDPAKFDFSISSAKGGIDQITGQLTISGSGLPKTDPQAIAKMLAGKSRRQADNLIKKNYPRVYNYKLDTNFESLKWINPLPFRLKNIIIVFK